MSGSSLRNDPRSTEKMQNESTPVGNAVLFPTSDNRDPTELGEALLAFKRRYRFKKLSTAYERMMDGQRKK